MGGCSASDAFVTKFNPTGSALVYSTFLGGSNIDSGSGIAIDSAGNAYVSGQTQSSDFPTTAGALQTVCGSGCTPSYPDAFVTKFGPTGSTLGYSTYLGSNNVTWGPGFAVDKLGNAYVTGTSYSFQNCYQTRWGTFCIFNAFVEALNSTGSALVYSVDVGNSNFSTGTGVAVDNSGNVYALGTALYGWNDNRSEVGTFAAKVNPAGLAVGSPTYLRSQWPQPEVLGYAVAADNSGNAYVTGYTAATDFPTKTPLQPANAGGYDAFISKIIMAAATKTTLSSSPNPSTYGQPVTFTASVSSSLGAPPDGETVSFMKGKTILGTGTLSSGSASFTTSTLPATTNAITAVYAGDSNFAPSTSTAVKQVVNKATTTIAVASSANPSTAGQSVTFTATITPQFTAKVTGNVTFYDGTTALKTVSVSGNAAKFTTSTLTSGSHNITTTYNGSTSFTSSSASLTQQVN